jgi:hypothetical protein
MLDKVRIFTQRFIGSRDLERLEAAVRAYYGTDEDGDFSWKVERKGGKKQIRALKANEFRQGIQRMLAIVCGTPSDFFPVPVNTDERSIEESLLARGVLDYYFDEGELDALCDYATEMAVVCTNAWVDVDWDQTLGEPLEAVPGVSRVPRMDATGQNVQAVTQRRSGDINARVFLATDTIREYESRRPKDEWIILRSWHNRYNLAAQMELEAQTRKDLTPEQRDEMMKNAELVRGLSSASNTDDEQLIRALRLQLGQVQPIDEVPVLDLRHARCPALPDGKRARLVGYSILLESGPNPFADDAHPDDLGAYEIRAGRRFGTTRSYSGAHDVLGKARAVDALTSIPYSNQAALGLNVLATPAMSELKLNKLKEGLVSVETKRPDMMPQVLQLCRTPPEVFPFRKDLIGEIGASFGLLDQSQGRGSADASGTRAALDDTITQRNLSSLTKERKKLRKNVANAIVRRFKTFGARMPRKLPLVVGKSKEPKLKEFTGSSMESIDRVRCEETGPFGSSVALRIATAKDIMQIKSTDGRPTLNAEQYITLVQTGKFEPLTEAANAEMQLIRAENEKLSAGEMLDAPPQMDPVGQPIPGTGQVSALWSENPWLHMREHDSVMSSLEAKANPAVRAAWQAHQAAHLPFLLEWFARSPRMIAKHGEPRDPYTGQPLMAPVAMPGAPPGTGAPPPPPGQKQRPQGGTGEPNLPSLPSNPATGERYTPTGAANG